MSAASPLAARLAQSLDAQVIETHISWVLLAGDFAYKLKKPLRLPFLDYSTLALRRACCEEEVRLNRRLAPSFYLGVSRITGSIDDPVLDGPGETLEYAVRMRRFPPGALFSEQAAAGTLGAAAVDRFAQNISRFHLAAPAACEPEPPGVDALEQRSLAVLEACRPLLTGAGHDDLRDWITGQARATAMLRAARRAAGRVREGHGDLHLANVFSFEGDVLAFDCIEFDAALRWIDVLEDAAFALMDFAAAGCSALGWRFFNGWLEQLGDHEGLPSLRLCLVYRALVRAAAHHLRESCGPTARLYAGQAVAWTRPAAPRLFITHGLPGSGKTFRSQQILERHGAIRVRSDVERKRLFGLEPLARSAASGVNAYTPEATRRTYDRLFALARGALRAGWPVVLDAAFLQRGERAQAMDLARELGVRLSILDCDAPLPVLRERLRLRQGDASEADLAVLEALRATAQPLDAGERALLEGS